MVVVVVVAVLVAGGVVVVAVAVAVAVAVVLLVMVVVVMAVAVAVALAVVVGVTDGSRNHDDRPCSDNGGDGNAIGWGRAVRSATLFEDDRSLIFILLSLYVMKSDQFGEMQTDAPESIITLELTVLI